MLEPGTAIHYQDLEALEKIEKVKVSEGDIILLAPPYIATDAELEEIIGRFARAVGRGLSVSAGR